jgi:hypothetical protein
MQFNKSDLYALALMIGCAMSTAHAQSMQEQLNAINAAESEIKATQDARRREYMRQQEQQAAAERAKRAEEQAIAQKQRESEEAHRRAASEKAEAAARQQREAVAKEKQRNQTYEDELRKMALEEKQLELQTKKAKVKRADDYIDQELNREKARTDVIQSEADATRNVSTGAKNMMTGIGKGEENKSKGWSLFKKKD